MPKQSGLSEIVCAAIRLSPHFGQLEPDEGLPMGVEVLLLMSTERYASTRQLPLICVPTGARLDSFVRESLQNILGGMLADSEVIHLGDGAQPKSSSKSRRPFCLLVLKNASSMELQSRSRRAAAGSPAFYSLASVRQAQFPCGKQSFACVQRVVEWLAARVTFDRLPLFFSQLGIAHALATTVSPPASPSHAVVPAAGAILPGSKQQHVVVVNPLRAAGLQHRSMADVCVRNGSFRAAAAKPPKQLCRVDWESEFALHSAARHGDLQAFVSLMEDGEDRAVLCLERDGAGWMPLHYAAWYGHTEVARALLDRIACPPNVTTSRDCRTALHLAAMSGQLEMLSLLLLHPQTDPQQRDAGGRSPHQLVLDLLTFPVASAAWPVEAEYQKRLQKASELLRNATRDKPPARINVHLMDTSTRSVALPDGAETSVWQLQQQMLCEMDFPPSSAVLFTFWICSKCFQLQLKSTQKPLLMMQDWRQKLPSLVDWASASDLRSDEPKLFWRRAVLLNVEREKQTQHLASLELLFHEAYQNYIKSFYPCAEKDVLVLATLLLFVRLPTSDVRKLKSFLSSEKQLLTVIPSCMLKNQPSQWLQRLTERYKALFPAYCKLSREELQFRFLSMCWNLTVYGSWLFTANINIKAAKYPVSVFVGINDIGVHILHGLNKTLLQSFQYADITWVRESNLRTCLDLRLKRSNHSAVVLRTKQATLMANLMDKLVGLKGPK